MSYRVNKPRAAEFAAAHSPIATRAELEARQKTRDTPKAEAHLTPVNAESYDVRRAVRIDAQERIKHLQERLEKAGAKLTTDRLRATLPGRARAEFERSR